MNWAAYGGHLETIKWLHQHRSEGCTEKTVCSAAAGGHLDVLEWLRADKTETLGYDAVDVAAAEGHLQGLKWSPADGASAMRDAVLRGHVPVMLFLYANYGHEVCQEGLCMLRENSEDTELRFLGMARWLLEKFEDEMVNFSVNRADWDTNQWVKNHMQQVESHTQEQEEEAEVGASKMPQAINELDVDFEAQIQEIKRLISSSKDADRRTALEEQLRELELQRIQDLQEQQQQEQVEPSAAASRRKSFRPASAKPRMSTLTPLAEDSEVTPTSFHGLDAHRLDDAGIALVSEVYSSSYDETFGPANVLETGSRTLWVSSGMFPQFLRIVLREPKRVAAVEITCRNVTKLQIRASPSRNVAANRMAVVGELEVSAADSGKLDTHRFALSRRGSQNDDEGKRGDANEKENAEPAVEAIQIDIESGYSDFVCVYFVRLRIASLGEITT